MRSPLALSLRLLKADGYVSGIVERRIGPPGETVLSDLFGVFDLVAIRRNTPGVLAVQTTSGSNVASRATKVLSSDEAKLWLSCENRIELHGWRKRKRVRGGRARLWVARVVMLTLNGSGEPVMLEERDLTPAGKEFGK